MKKNRSIIIGLVVLVAVIVLSSAAFVVKETEQVVITQFGRPVGEPITTPGLKFKLPFIQDINSFDRRYLEWDGKPNQVNTKDKKYIYIDTYARWQITDPLQFYKRMRDERGAQSRLDDILNGETRDFIATHNLEEAIRSTNRTPLSSGVIGELLGDSLKNIKVGRDKIQSLIQQSANKQANGLGIEILDFRIKRINYVEDVRTQVYERMKSERIRIAEQFRSEGQGEASRINGEKERELKTIQSEAFRIAAEVKGNADGEAAAIYANAYNKTPMARKLYSFLMSMETFEKTMDGETSIILSTNSELFKYLKGMD